MGGSGGGPRGPSRHEEQDEVASALTDALLPRTGDPVERIVRSTLELLGEQGTEAVTFDAVAAGAGVPVSDLQVQFADVDALIGFAFERTGEGLREVVSSASRPEDAVHLILPALAMHSPYARAFARVVLDGYGVDTVQRTFPLAEHLSQALARQREDQGAGPVDPQVAAAVIVTLSLSWHFNGDFLDRAYGLDQLGEVEVRRQLSTVLEAVVGLVTGPHLA